MINNITPVKKRILTLALLLGSAGLFNACEKVDQAPQVSKPIVTSQVEKGTIQVDNAPVAIGPVKDYEQESEVIYKLEVSSSKPLSRFLVAASADAFSSLSRIVKTEPANAIDAEGRFTQKLTSVTVYYAYHIHPLIAPLTGVTVDFSFQDESNYVGQTSHSFQVIKKGSTQGKPLNVIDMPYLGIFAPGIGNQNNIDMVVGTDGSIIDKRGAFYSASLRMDLIETQDALLHADKIDLVGYRTKNLTNNPLLSNNNFYLVSPSDTLVLTSTYAGSRAVSLQLTGSSGKADITVGGVTRTATFRTNVNTTASDFVNAHKAAYAAVGLTLTSSGSSLYWAAARHGAGFEAPVIRNTGGDLFGNDTRDTKDLNMRRAIRLLARKLEGEGKTLNKVYFKRLDNLTGPSQVTVESFDLLTHDNEFDTLLAGIREEGNTFAGPVGLDEVYGFVMEDGRRGLIKTSPTQAEVNGITENVPRPNAGNYVLWGTIKIQDNK